MCSLLASRRGPLQALLPLSLHRRPLCLHQPHHTPRESTEQARVFPSPSARPRGLVRGRALYRWTWPVRLPTLRQASQGRVSRCLELGRVVGPWEAHFLGYPQLPSPRCCRETSCWRRGSRKARRHRRPHGGRFRLRASCPGPGRYLDGAGGEPRARESPSRQRH